MPDNKLYANIKKCVFCAPEISVLSCYVSKSGVRADLEKVSSAYAKYFLKERKIDGIDHRHNWPIFIVWIDNLKQVPDDIGCVDVVVL